MSPENKVQLFQEHNIRSHWDEQEEQWYFSIIDVVAVLTESKNPQTYWRVLKKRLLDVGNETVTNCNGLKMLAADGKMRATSVPNISIHITNVLKDKELEGNSVVKDYLTTASDGKDYNVTYYALDMILAIGFMVRSKCGIQFRIWKNQLERIGRSECTFEEGWA